MTLNAKASQAAAAYISDLGADFAPDVVAEFRAEVVALDRDEEDRSADLLKMIDEHDVVNEPRTMDAYLNGLGNRVREPGKDGGDGGGKADKPKSPPKLAMKKPAPKADGEKPKAAPKAEGKPDAKPGAAPVAPADAEPAAAAAPDDQAEPGAPGSEEDGEAKPKVVLAHNQRVAFEHGDEKAGVTVRGEGKIVASGPAGAIVKDDEGREHKVHHANLRPVAKSHPLLAFGRVVAKSDPEPAAEPAQAATEAPAPMEEAEAKDPRATYMGRALNILRNAWSPK